MIIAPLSIFLYYKSMDRKIIYRINQADEGLTIEKYLKSQGYSSANITAIKKMPQNVLINGEWVHMNYRLAKDDTLTVNIQEDSSSEKIPPIKMDLDIIYEDEDIIVLNKPAGLSIHPSLNHYEDSLANGLAFYFESQDKPFIFRCANRLDKNTSGLTVIAKHLVSANILSTQVRDRLLSREYYAIVRGSLPQKEGTIDAPIGRVDDSIITRQVDFSSGQPAVTHYQVIDEKNGHSLLSIHLETGRTHQIRVHMKYIGFPLIGDYLYNPDFEYMTRQALHSHKLCFKHPITGQLMEFEAPLPADMQQVLQE